VGGVLLGIGGAGGVNRAAALFGRALLRIVPVEWLRLGAGVLFLVVGVIVLIDAVPAVVRR
jgi:putative Ca2+/H+ antiporter (TMEM165/GDT1 family)